MITGRDIYKDGVITARPGTKMQPGDINRGLQRLHLDSSRDALLYVPNKYEQDSGAALAVMLHGAGGLPEHGLELIRQYADKENIILLAPASRAGTWDIIVKRSFDADVIFIDKALTVVFENLHIKTDKIAIGGFSDGASYALCLGLSNGDLFTHVIAFSPGFYVTVQNNGKPTIFISHGTRDSILPIGPCSRRIVPRLKHLHYNVVYHEFAGEHEIPSNISSAAIDWFAAR